jgi:cell division septum initiation protein DivIVA
MTELDARNPEFTVGIRGYDRAQADEYVDYLQRLVADAERRARDAEAEFEFDEHAAVGPRIAEIFALAEAEARDLRDRASTQFGGLVDEARTRVIGPGEETVELPAIVDDTAAALTSERL